MTKKKKGRSGSTTGVQASSPSLTAPLLSPIETVADPMVKALQESEASLRAFLNSVPHPASIIDKGGIILVTNQAMAGSLGRRGQNIIGSCLYDLLPPPVAVQRKAKIEEAVQAGRPVRYEEASENKHLLHFISPMADHSHAVSRIALLALDITDRIRAEEALRESEEIHRTVVTQANDGIAIIQDDTVRFINPRLAEMGGYAREEVVGKPFTDFLSPEDIPVLKGFYDGRMAGQKVPAKYEVRLRQKNRDSIFIEVNSSIISYENRPAALVVIRDITQRRKTETLRESIVRISAAASSSDSLDDLFRSIHMIIADLMPAKNFYIALLDPQTNILSFPYFVDEFDPPPAPKKPGRGLTEYVLRTGRPLLASPQVFADLERRGEAESIGAPSIDWLGVPLNIENRTIGALVVQSYTEGVRYGEEEKDILKFVSDQVAMAVHRKEAEARLKASLEEKDVLLKEIHHRVKNNMQVISSLLNLQARQIKDPRVLEAFKESQRRIRSMALIHERLYQSGDLSRIEFSQYLRNLATHLFHSYQVDANRVRIKMEAEEVFLNINTAIPCGLIVNELISNALKHAFPDGRPGELEIVLGRAAGGGYMILVRDNGIGLPPGLDFRRTETLGMQIVSTLVGQIDGRLELESLKNNRGTVFELQFNDLPRKKRA